MYGESFAGCKLRGNQTDKSRSEYKERRRGEGGVMGRERGKRFNDERNGFRGGTREWWSPSDP